MSSIWSWFNNISSNPNATILCDSMASISSSIPLKIILFYKSILSIFIFPFLMIFYDKISKSALCHFNTKCIINAHIFFLLWHSLARIFEHSTDLMSYILSDDPCTIIPSTGRCLLERLFFIVPFVAMAYSAFFIGLERYFATKMAARYDENRTVGPVLLIFQCIVVMLHMKVTYTKLNLKSIAFYCFATTTGSPLYTVIPGCIMLSSQITCLIIFRHLKIINQRVTWCINSTLSVQFQIKQVLRALNILSPIVKTSSVFLSIFISMQLALIYFNSLLDLPVFFSLVEGINLTPEYTLLLPILVARRYQKVNRETTDYFMDLNQDSIVSDGLRTAMKSGTEIYFAQIAKEWN